MVSPRLEFVASITVCPSDIRKIREHVKLTGSPTDPLRNVLITPLFALKGSLELVRQMAAEGKNVFFDSGGYYVQTGRMTYDELYMPLLKAYDTHRWASVYVLPDHVPTSQDSPEVVDQKVNDTINVSCLFFEEMRDELKPRAMPVVHGHTIAQVDRCLQAYISLGVKIIGFGSFGTVGKKSEVNIASRNAVELASYTIQVAHAHGIRVHTFGLGVPALAAMLSGIQADSFDSSSWLKSAGFGQIFMPFTRAYNITHENKSSELQKGIKPEEFRLLQELTGHRCELCESIPDLQAHKMYRAAHNLVALAETVDMLNNREYQRIQRIFENGSGKYRKEFEKWLQPN